MLSLLLLLGLLGCSAEQAAPPGQELAALDRAVATVSSTRAAVLADVDAIQRAATAIDRTDARCADGAGSAARASYRSAQPRAERAGRAVTGLSRHLAAYRGALRALQRTPAPVDDRQRAALTAVVRGGEPEADAVERFAAAAAGSWPSYRRLARDQGTWTSRAVAGWYRSADEGAAAYAVLVRPDRAALEAARQRLETAAQAVRPAIAAQSAVLADADRVLAG